jgi:hypothetical protein
MILPEQREREITSHLSSQLHMLCSHKKLANSQHQVVLCDTQAIVSTLKNWDKYE